MSGTMTALPKFSVICKGLGSKMGWSVWLCQLAFLIPASHNAYPARGWFSLPPHFYLWLYYVAEILKLYLSFNFPKSGHKQLAEPTAVQQIDVSHKP